ncbi:MAG: hypothetical protein K9I85_06045 [Saprospiraceae bacterium]|nr:hypothetical protein [Saprospiraceae bacterium]
MQDPILNAATYEVVITSASLSKFILPDDSILREKEIVGIAIRNQNSAGSSQGPSGRVLVSNVALDVAFLSIFQDSKAILSETPANYFVPNYRQGDYMPVRIKQFSPSTSYVRFTDNARITAQQAVEITFYYID